MRESKYLSFPVADRDKLESTDKSNFQIQRVKIKSPNNPVKTVEARLKNIKHELINNVLKRNSAAAGLFLASCTYH